MLGRCSVLFILAGLGISAGCSPQIPDATYVCAAMSECPPGLFCDLARGLCVREAPCTPLTCEDLRAECGAPDDRCGGTLDCGECVGEDTCGGGGVELICGCAPATCASAGAECGVVSPGCGAPMLDCGRCPSPQSCGSDNRCSCTDPDACAAADCGQVVDACGEVVECGTCPPGRFCTAGVCGDTPCTPDPDPCGASACGTVSDGCGGAVDCGAGCTAPDVCDMTDTPYVCRCESGDTCDGLGIACGGTIDSCGDPLMCPSTCASDERCVGNACVCREDAYEPNDVEADVTPRTVTLGAGGTSDVVRSPNVDSPGDDDFYGWRWETSSASRELSVFLRRIPPGEDYDLEVYVDCDSAFMVGDFPCAFPATRLAGRYGCASAMASTASETVVMTPGCFDANVVVRVVATSGGTACDDYELEVRSEGG